MKSAVDNRLADIRQRRGVAASDLAERVGVRRQTIYAIEAGTYLPNTELALKLARELGVSVHYLFSLKSASPRAPRARSAQVLQGQGASVGPFVRMCRVGDRWVGVPVSAAPYYLPDADGLITKPGRDGADADVALLERERRQEHELVIAGCDPAATLLGRLVEEACGVRLVPAAASSRLALELLRDGMAHLAGTHLEDSDSGEFNVPFVDQHLPSGPVTIVTLARWEAGLVVSAGNAKAVASVDDLARPDVTFVNREQGSGSRALLVKQMKKAGMTGRSIRGFNRTVPGHLAAAYRVASGDADACMATRSAARSFGLDFIPIQSERYDLVISQPSRELPAVQMLLDALQHGSVRRRFEDFTGYDTGHMGRQLA